MACVYCLSVIIILQWMRLTNTSIITIELSIFKTLIIITWSVDIFYRQARYVVTVSQAVEQKC